MALIDLPFTVELFEDIVLITGRYHFEILVILQITNTRNIGSIVETEIDS